MRISPRKAANNNCVLDAPGYGRVEFMIDGLGYGMSVFAKEGVTPRKRVFYPQVVTSGKWYINAIFPSVEERDALHGWLLFYTAQAVNPYTRPTRKPITVTVVKEGFTKVGYPSSSINFGDDFGQVLYSTQLLFVSASDPEVSGFNASKYVGPTRDGVAKNFYPGGTQDNDLPDPVPRVSTDPDATGDSIWDFIRNPFAPAAAATTRESYNWETGQTERVSVTQPYDSLDSGDYSSPYF